MADDIKSLRKKLEAIPKAAREAAMASLQKSADELVNAQKALVPVRSGALRDSIRAEARHDQLKIVVIAGGPTTTKAARAGHGSYDYSLGVEHGTAEMAAEPFFYPAYRLLKKRLRNRTKRAINKAVKQEFSK
ncbi:MAG: HK97 gp10 family phage protein [Proteobacteria bacterium]|nr:HK97 gp10 family phage protein [Pseudomonadota bacterium]